MSFDEFDEKVSEKVLDWLTRIGALATALATILALFFPSESAKKLGFVVAFLLATGSALIFVYRRRRASRLEILESVEPLSPTAALRGLLPFEEGDELPGRAQDVQQLYTLVAGSTFRFGVLWGESGCGKTSLLRAGLVPKLRSENYVPLYVAKPTKDPRNAIRATLEREFSEMAQRADEDLELLLRDIASDKEKVVILLDQFEEFFLLNRTPRSRASFSKWLGKIVRKSDLPPIVFLVSIRADFFARLQNFAPHIEEPTSVRTTLQLHNLYKKRAKSILMEAAKADGVEFDPELIDAVVNDLEVEDIIRPAELQIVGTRLKRKNILKLSRYEAVGRARGILSSYIRDEVEKSANQQVARLVLRALCAEAGEAKAPVDLGLEEIMDAILGPQRSRGGKSEIHLDQIQSILNHFVAARILILTENRKYNLVHDYLAPYVYIATKDVETNADRANRLLRRYLADYEEDQRTNIPIRALRYIRKYASAELQNTWRAQELLRKSRRSFYMEVGSSSIVPMTLLLMYLFLINRYYLTESHYPGSGTYLVRSGDPNWTFLPLIGDVVAEIEIADIGGARYVIQDEKMTGFWLQRSNGYHLWAEQLIERLANPDEEALVLYRLGQPGRAQEVLEEGDLGVGYYNSDCHHLYPIPVTSHEIEMIVDTILDEKNDFALYERIWAAEALCSIALSKPQASIVTPEIVQALVRTYIDTEAQAYGRERESVLQVLTSINPDAVTHENLKYLSDIVHDPKSRIEIRVSAAQVLSQLALANPQGLPEMSNLVQDLTDIVKDPRISSSYRSDTGYALGRLVQARSSAVSPETTRSLMDIVSDPKEQPSLRINVASVLAQIGSDSPYSNSEVILSVLDAITTDRGHRYSYGDYGRVSSLDVLEQLVRADAQALTPEFFQHLALLIKNPNTSDSSRAIAIDALGKLIQADFEDVLVPPEVLECLITTMQSSEIYRNSFMKALDTLTKLVQSSPQVVGSGTVQTLFAIATDPEVEYARRLGAVSILAQIENVKPDVTERQVLQLQISSLIRVLLDSDISQDQTLAAAHALGILAQARPETVTSRLIQEQISFSPMLGYYYDDDYDTTSGGREASFQQLVKANPDAVTPEAIQVLVSHLESKHASVRTNGVYASFLITAGAPDLKDSICEEVTKLRNSPKPHVRIAASKALEMMRIGNLAQEVWTYPERMEHIKLQLELLADSQQRHVKYAAMIALQEIDRYEKVIK